MSLEHSEVIKDTHARELVEAYGGKLGLLEWVRSHSADLADKPIPGVFMRRDEQWSGTLPPSNAANGFLIRASHPCDITGLVDALPTRIVYRSEDIPGVIDEIRKRARDPEVMAYAQCEDPSYDGAVAIGIQPYVPSRRASVLQHPNIPNDAIVSYTDAYDDAGYRPNGVHGTAVFSRSGSMRWLTPATTAHHIRELVEVLDVIESSNLFHHGHALHCETLADRCGGLAYLTQVRVFKKRENHPDFKIETGDVYDNFVLGTTPEEGFVLPLLHSPDGLDKCNKSLEDVCATPYALMKTYHCASPPLSFRPGRLAAYLVSQSYGSGIYASLDHNHLRLAQKAEVTVFEGNRGRDMHRFSKFLGMKWDINQQSQQNIGIQALMELSEMTDFTKVPQALRELPTDLNLKVRIISNGRQASIQPLI